MTSTDSPEDAAHRPRLAILVDNAVEGDSRVQKEAESAAAAGWDVLLIGRRNRTTTRTQWSIGGARVRLVKEQSGLGTSRAVWRRAPLRAPLAYSSFRHSDYRTQLNRVHLSDVAYRVDLARVSGAAEHGPRIVALRGQLLWLKLQRRWIARRAARTRTLDLVRKNATGQVDRFWAKVHLRRGRGWRQLSPAIMSWETAYTPTIRAFDPDVIHANDFRMLPAGAMSKVRAAARGRTVKLVWDAHEFLPGIHTRSPNVRWHAGHIAMEKEFAHHADAVITVTEPLADLLVAEHGLTERPTVVANAPIIGALADPDLPDLRTALGLAADVPLLVYCGGLAPMRGLETVVRGLPQLPGVHLALIVPSFATEYGRHLLAVATDLGVRDRVLGHPYVAPDQIARFLTTATAGVIPLHRIVNHDISLPTKYFEFCHARLPIITSDTPALVEAVTEHHQGEVFTAEDVDGFVRATEIVLANPDAYCSAYDDADLMRTWTWEHQADKLLAVYESLRGEQPR